MKVLLLDVRMADSKVSSLVDLKAYLMAAPMVGSMALLMDRKVVGKMGF